MQLNCLVSGVQTLVYIVKMPFFHKNCAPFIVFVFFLCSHSHLIASIHCRAKGQTGLNSFPLHSRTFLPLGPVQFPIFLFVPLDDDSHKQYYSWPSIHLGAGFSNIWREKGEENCNIYWPTLYDIRTVPLLMKK